MVFVFFPSVPLLDGEVVAGGGSLGGVGFGFEAEAHGEGFVSK